VIVEVLQDGYEQTYPTSSILAPELDTGDEVFGSSGYTRTIDVGEGNMADQNFGNRLIPPATSSLSGVVYLDPNNDGARGSQEPGLPNVTITLLQDNVQLQQVTTGPDGWYHFEGLEPGTYTIRQTQPECFHDGKDTLGIVLPDGDTRGVAGNDEFTVELGAGEHGIEYLFGELGLRASCVNKRQMLTSTPPTREAICDRLGISCTTVYGTDDDDTIVTVTDGTTILVDVNGSSQEFDTAEVQIVMIDAGGGNDSVTLNGSSNQDFCYVDPVYASLRRDDVPLNAGYGLDATGAERIVVGPAGGDDLVVMVDSPSDDALAANGSRIDLRVQPGTDPVVSAGGLGPSDRVRAISISGGTDTVEENTPDFPLDLLGDWTTL
jgi:hypothetical protein